MSVSEGNYQKPDVCLPPPPPVDRSARVESRRDESANVATSVVAFASFDA